MASNSSSAECLSVRVARAGRHVARGEWASGHAIVSGLRRCAQGGGCPCRADCAQAAERLMGHVRRLLGD